MVVLSHLLISSCTWSGKEEGNLSSLLQVKAHHLELERVLSSFSQVTAHDQERKMVVFYSFRKWQHMIRKRRWQSLISFISDSKLSETDDGGVSSVSQVTTHGKKGMEVYHLSQVTTHNQKEMSASHSTAEVYNTSKPQCMEKDC